MSDVTYTTVLIIQSKHEPTNAELDRVVDGALEEGTRQGFDPLRATAIRERGGDPVHREHRANIEKWEGRNA